MRNIIFAETCTGQLCGAIQLDKGFRELLKRKVSPKVWEQISDSKDIFDDQWELYIKRRFPPKRGREGKIHIDEPFPQVVKLPRYTQNTTEHFTQVQAHSDHSAELQSIFDSVVDSNLELVYNQINLVCGQIKKTTPRARGKGPPVKVSSTVTH
jgi:hypothetical protein